MQIDTKGGYGRQARYSDVTAPVLRLAHPLTFETVQVPSKVHKLNMLQYAVAPGVRSVKVGRFLPTWISAFVLKRATPTTQVIELNDGTQLIVRVGQAWDQDEPVATRLRPKIWYLERSTLHVSLPAVLNRNLDLLTQAHTTHHAVDLRRETGELSDALQRVPSTTVGDLKSYARLRLSLPPNLVDVILVRLLLDRKLSVHLVSAPYRDATAVCWGSSGVGYLPPMPGLEGAQTAEAA